MTFIWPHPLSRAQAYCHGDCPRPFSDDRKGFAHITIFLRVKQNQNYYDLTPYFILYFGSQTNLRKCRTPKLAGTCQGFNQSRSMLCCHQSERTIQAPSLSKTTTGALRVSRDTVRDTAATAAALTFCNPIPVTIKRSQKLHSNCKRCEQTSLSPT